MKTSRGIISDAALVCCIEDLRDALGQVNQINARVIFINPESFYSYISDYRSKEGKSVEELLTIIEPFIPVIVTDRNIDMFLRAAMSNDEQSLNEMENELVQNSKIKFIKSILDASSEQQWNEILDICKTIRGYKEEGLRAK